MAKRTRSTKTNLLNAAISAGLTKDDKLAFKKYRDDNHTTYAELIRTALYAYYPTVFRK